MAGWSVTDTPAMAPSADQLAERLGGVERARRVGAAEHDPRGPVVTRRHGQHVALGRHVGGDGRRRQRGGEGVGHGGGVERPDVDDEDAVLVASSGLALAAVIALAAVVALGAHHDLLRARLLQHLGDGVDRGLVGPVGRRDRHRRRHRDVGAQPRHRHGRGRHHRQGIGAIG